MASKLTCKFCRNHEQGFTNDHFAVTIRFRQCDRIALIRFAAAYYHFSTAESLLRLIHGKS